jgi:hypothetical protein
LCPPSPTGRRVGKTIYAQNAYKTSIAYANNHTPLNDPVAEELLTDHAEFFQKSIWHVIRDLGK